MKQTQTIRRKINEAMEYIDTMKSTKPNCIRLNSKNTDSHELMKYMICRQLNKEGKLFYTEVVFKNGKRADIYVPEDLKVIEILATETELMCEKKTQRYPEAFEIIMVSAEQEWNDKLIY